jgi:4-amino-4-deoxy-L-arabinose transferase-like glycosyltransferase
LNTSNNNLLPYLLITLGGLLLFLPFLGYVALFDWDEVNFAEIAREMIVTKDYLSVQINYQPFWEKPPLFMWMQVLSMKLFGVNEFAARFPNAVCGIATLLILFSIGKKLFNQKMGIIWVLVYAGSILPFFYFKSGIIDPWFNLFIFLGIYFAVRYIESSKAQLFNGSMVNDHIPSPNRQTAKPPNRQTVKPSNRPIFFAGLAIGLAILTKGPVGLLIFGLTSLVYLLLPLLPSYSPTVLKSSRPTVLQSSRPTVLKSSRPPVLKSYSPAILLFFAGLIITGGSWFFIMIANGHLDTVKDFIIYQVRLFSTKDAGHGGFPGYHIVVLLLGVFPASAFLFNGFKADDEEQPLQKEWRRACIILLLTVVILFEIVQTKIVHYSSLAYFPLTYLSALAIYRITEGKSRINKLSAIVLGAFALLWILVITGFTIAGLNKEWLMHSGLIKDPFAVANLAADIRWSGWEALVGSILIIGMLAFFILKKPLARMVALFVSSIIFTFFTMFVFTGKIEGYAQRAALDFYRECSKEDCYIKTLGFKSYAHYFYGKTLPQENPLYYDNDWLLHGKLDKTAYFVYKITKKEEYSRIYPQLTILYEQNGFIFAARYPENQNSGL